MPAIAKEGFRSMKRTAAAGLFHVQSPLQLWEPNQISVKWSAELARLVRHMGVTVAP